MNNHLIQYTIESLQERQSIEKEFYINISIISSVVGTNYHTIEKYDPRDNIYYLEIHFKASNEEKSLLIKKGIKFKQYYREFYNQ